MSYTVTQLITEAYSISGIVGEDYETVSGKQLHQGLIYLNDVLATKTANARLIPYYQPDFPITCEIGEGKYFITKLIEVDTLTFSIGNVQYPMEQWDRNRFFQTAKVLVLPSLPFTFHVERAFGGANIYLYPQPNAEYPMLLCGKFSFTAVSLNQDLSLTLDQFYITYLKFALQEYLCAINTQQMTPQNAEKLKELESIILNVAPLDTKRQKVSTLSGTKTINYAQINLGYGWTTSR